MKLKMKTKRKFKKIAKLSVTDIAGKTNYFESVAQLANEMDVSVAYIYNALKDGRKIRGCAVEAEYQLDDDEAYFAK